MVKVLKTTQELISQRSLEKRSIGFVPTMGNLHQGHISLLKKGLEDFDVVYFSIFVNPTQFGPNEDFNRYPRTLENDLSLIENLLKTFPNKEVVVYAPLKPEEVYAGVEKRHISVLEIKDILEGSIRPGHFDGVATVVYRLFELVKPQKAYFGLKDYQQFLIIRRMVSDLQLPIQIVGMPIIREDSGLALSSRNQYLSAEQKEASLILSRSLKKIIQTLNGQRKNLSIAMDLITGLKEDPNWNYLELRDAESLSDNISSSKEITLLAVYQLGTTRLLDNMQMELQ